MTVRRASRGLQATRLVLAAGFLVLGAVAVLAGSWLTAGLLLAGALGAALAFRKGEWDPEEAQQARRDYVRPRLVGAGIGLVAFVVAAALGLLD